MVMQLCGSKLVNSYTVVVCVSYVKLWLEIMIIFTTNMIVLSALLVGIALPNKQAIAN